MAKILNYRNKYWPAALEGRLNLPLIRLGVETNNKMNKNKKTMFNCKNSIRIFENILCKVKIPSDQIFNAAIHLSVTRKQIGPS